MTTWRVAKSLDTLLDEIDKRHPRRSKISDGGIGDADHATRTSDHNPWVKDRNGIGVVRARDFTHDPAGGVDCHKLAAHLVRLLRDGGLHHPALGPGAYIIWNRRIISRNRISEGWRTYAGTNPHTNHLHLSVTTLPGGGGYDSTLGWRWEHHPDGQPEPVKKGKRRKASRRNVRTAERAIARAIKANKSPRVLNALEAARHALATIPGARR
jgi:hypothetical protein